MRLLPLCCCLLSVLPLAAVDVTEPQPPLLAIDALGLQLGEQEGIRILVHDTFHGKDLVVLAIWGADGDGRITRYEVQPFDHLTEISAKSYALPRKNIQQIKADIVGPKITTELDSDERQTWFFEYQIGGEHRVRRSPAGTDGSFQPVLKAVLSAAKVKVLPDEGDRIVAKW